MKIYICGKITGDPEYRRKFRCAERRLKREGHIVLNPAVLPSGLKPGDYATICGAFFQVAEGVAFLPDHNDSKGASIELAMALYCGDKQIMYL